MGNQWEFFFPLIPHDGRDDGDMERDSLREAGHPGATLVGANHTHAAPGAGDEQRGNSDLPGGPDRLRACATDGAVHAPLPLFDPRRPARERGRGRALLRPDCHTTSRPDTENAAGTEDAGKCRASTWTRSSALSPPWIARALMRPSPAASLRPPTKPPAGVVRRSLRSRRDLCSAELSRRPAWVAGSAHQDARTGPFEASRRTALQLADRRAPQ